MMNMPPNLPSSNVTAEVVQAPPSPGAGASAQAYIDAEFVDVRGRHLRDYLWILHKYRWLAATCFGVVFGLSCLLTMLASRVYTASTRVQVTRESPIQLQLDQNVLRGDDADRLVNGSSSFLATQVQTLRSRDLAERVIRQHRLAENDAFLNPSAGRAGLRAMGGGLLALLRPRGFGDAGGTPADDASSTDEVPTALLERYVGWLRVGDVRGTDLIDVSFTTPSPTLSAFLAAAHTQAYIQTNEEARRATDVTAKEFLGQQMREARERVERAQEALRRFATEHPAVAVNEEQKTQGQRVGDLTTLLTQAEVTRIKLESRFKFLSEPQRDPLAFFLDRPAVEKTYLQLKDLEAQQAGLEQELGPKHPDMAALLRQKAALEAQLAGAVAKESSAVHEHYAASLARESSLREKLEAAEAEGVAQRDMGARYDFLKNDVEGARALHASLLKQQLETSVNSQLTPSNVRVVERAEVPAHPSKPNVPLNLTLGLLGGLAVACGAAFASEYFDSSVKSTEEAEELLQLPTLATIPNFALAHQPAYGLPSGSSTDAAAGSPEARPLVVRDQPRSVVAEAFRTLRTAVLFSTPGHAPKLILVTSATASEGKTVNCLNLAAALAESGSRVLLIDVDLRHPSCHRGLGVENAVGLSNYLAGQKPLEDIVQRLDSPKLTFVPAGPTPPNPAELVGSKRMSDLIQLARRDFDFVLLDSPPVTPVSDALVLSRASDGVVLVVKGQDTPKDLVRRARDQLVMAGANLLGTVVNNVGPTWGEFRFYQRYYGYYHRPVLEEGAA
jgi:capsular exopolysaccharide synthesis family protein